MAELITNEQEVKRQNQFLKLENGSVVTIQSNLIHLTTHFMNEKKLSVMCAGSKDCVFCKQGIKTRTEYFYHGIVGEEEGTIRLPASVFYAINESEKVLKKDKRNYQWLITKKGEGLSTRYTVTRGDDIKANKGELEEKNRLLLETINRYESNLKENYNNIAIDIIPVEEAETPEKE